MMLGPLLPHSANKSAVSLDMRTFAPIPVLLVAFLLLSHCLVYQVVASEDDFQPSGDSEDYSRPRDHDNRPFEREAEPAEPTFDDSPSESLERTNDEANDGGKWASERFPDKDNNDREKDDTNEEPQKKNIFIYVPFRPNFRRNADQITTSTTIPTTVTTPKPKLPNRRPTARTTFSSPWPPVDSPSLRSIARSAPESKDLDKWRPVSGLKESASSSVYAQAVPVILQSPPQVVQSSPQFVQSFPASFQTTGQVLQSPQLLLSSPPLLSPPSHQVVHSVQQTQAVNDVRVVEAPPQSPPVHVNLVQGPPAPPVHLNIVRSPPQPPAVHVNFVRSQPLPVLSPPVVQQQFVQAAPVLQAPILQAPVIHAHPVVHAPVFHAAPQPLAPPVFAPIAAAPPCPQHAPAFHPLHHHTFFSAPQAQRTRTVLQQVQFVPEQTHVYTTTSYSPATRTTIYESDHVAAFSAPKPRIVKAPTARVVHRNPSALITDREGPATVYTFPKMRILGAPIRMADRLSSRRQLRQRLREERLKEKQSKEKEKKIFVFNRRSSS